MTDQITKERHAWIRKEQRPENINQNKMLSVRIRASNEVLSSCSFYSTEGSDQRWNVSVQSGILSICGNANGSYGLRKASVRPVGISARLLSCMSLKAHVALTSDTPPAYNRNLQAGGFWQIGRIQLLDS